MRAEPTTSHRLEVAVLLLLVAACEAGCKTVRQAPPPSVSAEPPFATEAPSFPETSVPPPLARIVEMRSESSRTLALIAKVGGAPAPAGIPHPAGRPAESAAARDSALDNLATGYFTVTVPRRMTVGQDVKARAQVSEIRQALIDAWKGAGIAQPEELKISEEMTVRLVCSPLAFDVTPKDEWWQLVGGETTQWEWNITPLKSGSYALSFIFSVRLHGRPPHDRESHDEQIEVSVAPGPPPTPTPTPAPLYRTVLSGVGAKLKENIVLAIVGLITAVAVGLRKKLVELVKSRWE